MAVFSGAGKLWLYSGVTTTKASAAASRDPSLRTETGRSSSVSASTSGSRVTARSTTSSSRSPRRLARAVNQSATVGPKRPLRVLPMMTTSRRLSVSGIRRASSLYDRRNDARSCLRISYGRRKRSSGELPRVRGSQLTATGEGGREGLLTEAGTGAGADPVDVALLRRRRRDGRRLPGRGRRAEQPGRVLVPPGHADRA